MVPQLCIQKIDERKYHFFRSTDRNIIAKINNEIFLSYEKLVLLVKIPFVCFFQFI